MTNLTGQPETSSSSGEVTAAASRQPETGFSAAHSGNFNAAAVHDVASVVGSIAEHMTRTFQGASEVPAGLPVISIRNTYPRAGLYPARLFNPELTALLERCIQIRKEFPDLSNETGKTRLIRACERFLSYGIENPVFEREDPDASLVARLQKHMERLKDLTHI